MPAPLDFYSRLAPYRYLGDDIGPQLVAGWPADLQTRAIALADEVRSAVHAAPGSVSAEDVHVAELLYHAIGTCLFEHGDADQAQELLARAVRIRGAAP